MQVTSPHFCIFRASPPHRSCNALHFCRWGMQGTAHQFFYCWDFQIPTGESSSSVKHHFWVVGGHSAPLPNFASLGLAFHLMNWTASSGQLGNAKYRFPFLDSYGFHNPTDESEQPESLPGLHWNHPFLCQKSS